VFAQDSPLGKINSALPGANQKEIPNDAPQPIMREIDGASNLQPGNLIVPANGSIPLGTRDAIPALSQPASVSPPFLNQGQSAQGSTIVPQVPVVPNEGSIFSPTVTPAPAPSTGLPQTLTPVSPRPAHFESTTTATQAARSIPVNAGGHSVPQELVLPNGLRLVLLEEHSFPVVSCLVWYRVGSRNESPGLTGLSHLVEHLLFQNVGTFKKNELGASIVANGGQFNGFTSEDFTAFYSTVAPSKLDLVLRGEAERMRSAKFTHNDVQTEVSALLREFDEEGKDPVTLLNREVHAIAFQQHPYRNPPGGWRSDAEHLTYEDAHAFYERYFYPDNASLVLVGDFKKETALPLVKKYFLPLAKAPYPIPNLRVAEKMRPFERRVTMKYGGKKECLIVAYPAPAISDADAPAMTVLEKVLNGPISGRLRKQLLETRVCSSAQCVFEIKRDPSLLILTLNAGGGTSLQKVLEASDAIVNQLRSQLVSDAELSRARRQAEFECFNETDGPYLSGFHLGYFETLMNWQSAYAWPDKIRSVSAADLQRLARLYLFNDARVVGQLVSTSSPQVPGTKTTVPSANNQTEKTIRKTGPVEAMCPGVTEVVQQAAKRFPHLRLAAYKQSDSAVEQGDTDEAQTVEKPLPSDSARNKLLARRSAEKKKKKSIESVSKRQATKSAGEAQTHGAKKSTNPATSEVGKKSSTSAKSVGSQAANSQSTLSTKSTSNQPVTKSTSTQSTKPTYNQLTRPITDQQTKSTSVQPAKSESVQPAKSTSVQPTKSDSVQPAKSTSVQPIKSTSVQPAKSESAQPTKSTSVQPAKSDSAQPTKSTTVQPAKSDSVQPAKSTSVERVPVAPTTLHSAEPPMHVKTMTETRAQAPRSFSSGSMSYKTLSNGLEVVVVESHLNPIVQVIGSVQAGSVFDPTDKKGLSALTALAMASGKSTRQQTITEQDDMGLPPKAMIKFDSGLEEINFQTRCLSKDFSSQLTRLVACLREPRLQDADIEKAKADLLVGISQSEDMVSTKVERALLRSMMPSTSLYYPVDPSERARSIATLKPVDVRDFYSTHVTPNLTALVVAGDVQANQVFALLDHLSSGWSPKKDFVKPPVLTTDRHGSKSSLPLKDSTQSLVCLGRLIGAENSSDKTWSDLLIADCALTNHPIFSRINQRLEHEPNLAASFRAEALKAHLQPLSEAIIWSLYLPVDASSASNSVAAIQNELKHYGKAGLTLPELTEAKRYLLGSIPVNRMSNLDNLCKFYLEGLLQRKEPEPFAKMAESIRTASLESVNKFILGGFKPDQAAVVVAGNRQLVRQVHPAARPEPAQPEATETP
jgi:zinc protease